MRVARREFVAPAIAFLFFVSAGLAQQRQKGPEFNEWEFSVFGGASFLGNHSYPTPVTGSSTQTSRVVDLRYATGFQLGARVTENRGRRWGAVLEYSFTNQPVTFTGLSATLPSFSPGHSIHRFGYDILFYTADRTSRLRPYALAGTGLALYYPHHQPDPTQNFSISSPWKFALEFGGGVKYMIRNQFGVSVQYSNAITTAPAYGLPPTATQNGSQFLPGMNAKGHFFDSLINVGLIYSWNQR